MDSSDRFCTLSYDEMYINEQMDFDKSSGEYVGPVTLGGKDGTLGDNIFLVLAQGIKDPWKQVIACHVTASKEATEKHRFKTFMIECISAVERCGLHVLAFSSDLDSKNKSLWNSLGISVTTNGPRINNFEYNEHPIYAIPDVCHILNNFKSAVLRQSVYLPDSFVEVENLPTNIVERKHVQDL